MSQEPTVLQSESPHESSTHIVHALMQFLLAIRYRWNVVATSLAVAGLLGGLYFATATRYYGARAKIFVRPTGDNLSPSMTADGMRQQSLMPTFENLLSSTKVVEGAIKYLQPEDRIDLAGAPKTAWAGILKKNLSTQVVPNTYVIEVGCRSKDAKAAVSVVNALVQSYIEFLDETHRGAVVEIKNILTEEKTELAGQLAQKNQQLLQAKYQAGDLGIRPDSPTVHPVVRRAIYFNEVLIEAQRERAELEATLATIEAAVRNGQNLQQLTLTVADVVGKELLLRTLGFDSRDAVVQANLEQDLIGDRAVLNAMMEDLGPAHPSVIAKTNKIRMTEQYLLEYQQRIDSRLAEIQDTQLGPLLLGMVRQKLDETRQRERNFLAAFQQAQAEANTRTCQLAELGIIEQDLQWLRDLNNALADKIANINLAHDGREVRTAVTEPPMISEKPVSPSLRRMLMMVLAGGLGVGLALVYVLDILDDRFRNAEEMQAQLAVPVLAMVRQLKTSQSEGPEAIQVHIDPNSAECEAFRTLRTALALADREARQIVITSAEPGDGKTTVLANLAVSYAQANKRTLLIDADLRRPGLTAMLGMRGVEGLSGVVRGQRDVAEMAAAHIRPTGIEGLDVLSSGPRPSNPAELLANPRFSELLAWAESVYDQVLIDSPPALATSDACVIGRLVDGAVIVVQPHKNRRRLVVRAAESLAALKISLLGIVVNRVGSESDRGYYGYGYGYDYAAEYGADEEKDGVADGTSNEEDAPRLNFAEQRDRPQEDPAAEIVRRRIA